MGVLAAERRNGKVTKVPYQINGNLAASDKPSTWTSFENALAASELFDGVGFVFTADDPFCGTDIDDALVDGQLHPDAIRIVEALGSYAEWSPSRDGVHVIAQATKPAGACKTGKTPWGGKLEMYDRGRFFTVTGDRLPRVPRSVAERQEQLARVHAEFFPAHRKRERRGDDHRDSHAARSVEKLLEAHPRLEQIARRKGKQPGDGSASDWDIPLGCTARRSVRRPRRGRGTDPLLPRTSRRRQGRARDYVERTVDAVCAAEPLGSEEASEHRQSRRADREGVEPRDDDRLRTHGRLRRRRLRLPQLADGRELRFPGSPNCSTRACTLAGSR